MLVKLKSQSITLARALTNLSFDNQTSTAQIFSSISAL